MDVLIVLSNLRAGNGVASCINSYYDYLIKNNVKVSFLVQFLCDSDFEKKCRHNNSNIYVLPKFTGKFSYQNYKYCKEIFKKNEFDIVHNNLTGMNAILVLKCAKKCKVKIHHSHNPRENSSLKAFLRSIIFDPFIINFSNKYMACSTLAGDSVFKNKHYDILKNIIDIEKFRYDSAFRSSFRKDYHCTDKLLIGTVCRHAEQKNPYFIIDVFCSLKNKNNKTEFLWAGSGPLTNEIKDYASRKGILDDIIFLGSVDYVNKIYSVLDFLIFPSFFEGFGMVLIEAQVSGLKCFASDCIPKDTKLTDKVSYLSLDNSSDYWADQILCEVNYIREDCKNSVVKAGYDIEESSDQLYEFYKKYIKE